jgi:hypothetical protein
MILPFDIISMKPQVQHEVLGYKDSLRYIYESVSITHLSMDQIPRYIGKFCYMLIVMYKMLYAVVLIKEIVHKYFSCFHNSKLALKLLTPTQFIKN